jgi:hypothetical protein
LHLDPSFLILFVEFAILAMEEFEPPLPIAVRLKPAVMLLLNLLLARNKRILGLFLDLKLLTVAILAAIKLFIDFQYDIGHLIYTYCNRIMI